MKQAYDEMAGWIAAHFPTALLILGGQGCWRGMLWVSNDGILEVRTAAREEWIQPVAWIEWINDLGVPIRYMAQDIR